MKFLKIIHISTVYMHVVTQISVHFFLPSPSKYIVIYMNYILPLFRKLVIINICLIISDIQIQVKQDVERMKMTIFCEISYQIFYFQYYFKIHILVLVSYYKHCECVGELVFRLRAGLGFNLILLFFAIDNNASHSNF